MLTHHSPTRARAAALPPNRNSNAFRSLDHNQLPSAGASIGGRGDSDPIPRERVELSSSSQEATEFLFQQSSHSEPVEEATSTWSWEKTKDPVSIRDESSKFSWESSEADEDDSPSFGSVRFSSNGSIGVFLGNGTSLNSDGSVGFNVGGVSFNSNGTISWGL